ncbi:MAG: aromatic amino acid transaminase [Pseudomonadota bacterium]
MSTEWNDSARAVDPIIALMDTYNRDPRTEKINLGVGVYQDDLAETPVFQAVKDAEARLLEEQNTKTYVGVGGDSALVEAIRAEIFSNTSSSVTGIQGVGGSGALRLIAEFCGEVAPEATLWVSQPTWGNHFALFAASGLPCKAFPWRAFDCEGIVDGALDALADAKSGDFIILHACCHNPTGIDLPGDELDALCDAINAKGLVPIIDAAYVGFADGFEADARALGGLADRFPVAFTAFSASKNFALYRERLGVAFISAHNKSKLNAWQTILLSAARCAYSMPPDHGAAVVRTILTDPQLRASWLHDLDIARNRVADLRHTFATTLRDVGVSFATNYIAQGAGLFALLPLTREQAHHLREDMGIYLLDNGRVNIAGLRRDTIPRVVEAVAALDRASQPA